MDLHKCFKCSLLQLQHLSFDSVRKNHHHGPGHQPSPSVLVSAWNITRCGHITITIHMNPIALSARAFSCCSESSTMARCRSSILLFVCTRHIPPKRESPLVQSSTPFCIGSAFVCCPTCLHFHLGRSHYRLQVHCKFKSIAESWSPPRCSL
ncbi:hypothetical protein V6N13_013013 [Hibiscus sabdariffa]|uniref:Uncharacterized protein n=1 Tax=Hibiscus sabdariffa TaxID=183260 RepID=A0ABR2SH14_9ROSI